MRHKALLDFEIIMLDLVGSSPGAARSGLLCLACVSSQEAAALLI